MHVIDIAERNSNAPAGSLRSKASGKSDNAKNQALVEETWNAVSDRLGQFIRARVTEPAIAEDILHDVFVKFQSRLNEFRDPAKTHGWLFLVARNAVIDHYRTRKRTSELSESQAVDLRVTDTIEIEELHVQLRRIIDRLPEPYREAFVLTTFEGLKQEELARRLGISLSGAKSRVQRAREQLKEMLLDFCQREFSRTPGCQPCPHGLIPIGTAKQPVKQKPPRRLKKA